MFHLKQIQGLDFILKSITFDDKTYFHNKKLQLVVDIDGQLWRGDFLEFGVNGNVAQKDYNSTGHSKLNEHYPNEDTPILQKAHNGYLSTIPRSVLDPNPYHHMTELHILYYYLLKAERNMGIDEDTESNFYSYMYNVVSMDGAIELPFLDVAGKDIDFVSIVEVKE